MGEANEIQTELSSTTNYRAFKNSVSQINVMEIHKFFCENQELIIIFFFFSLFLKINVTFDCL